MSLDYLWGGPQPTDENENAELAMRAACDKHGTFEANPDGTLRYEDYIVLRSIIMRYSQKMFQPKKDELHTKKLEAFQEKNQNKYVTLFREGTMEFNKCVISITK